MRIGLDIAVAGKVLAAVAHARQQQALVQVAGQHADHARIGMEGAVADHGAAAMVQVQHRGEAEVDIAGAQLGGQHIAAGHRRPGRGQHVAVPQLAQAVHRRQVGKAVGLAALHAPAFMVDADQNVVAHRADGACQRLQLRARFEIAGEQDHAAGERMRDAARVLRVELLADDVEDHRARPLAGILLGHWSYWIHKAVGWEAGASVRSAIAKATA
ncbi:hypothetical protein D3C72_1584420 [compost metagenome]